MSQSASALLARIEELSSSIVRQQQVLRDLENQRSAVRGHLNSIRDPMARLPFEISSDIFMQCLPDTPQPHPRFAPMLLLNICKSWSSIALATPSLWTIIHGESQSAKFAELLEAWMSRARNLPFSISLPAFIPRAVRDVVKRHAGQVQNLELHIEDDEELQKMVAPFGSLKKMTVIGIDPTEDHVQGFPYGDSCLELLRAAPGLVECDLLNMHFTAGHSSAMAPLTHSHLQHLRLAMNLHLDEFDFAPGILQYLTLPALQTLSISDSDVNGIGFPSFLTRSSPPLRSLKILITRGDVDASWFQLTPELTDLDLFCSSYPAFLDKLTCAENYLPVLRNLTIRTNRPLSESSLQDLVAMLTARNASHHPFQEFRLTLPHWKAQAPDDEIILALRRLVEDGMHIHIGHGEHNYI
ncbi:hypothetical protein DFH07DRAFT_1060319 [Mycena maculata]|uniref:F-box domain-containing protein n=1 Tax=Mycena maculata TaxID=230809 RepID=A0AAD7NGD5_9AGAR|nr:hypothetical protein DFH07DRAFT_1060319 [Mycena maculata]